MKKKIYTISTAHLDTSWLWSQKETINIYLPRTLHENFEWFKKYPNYKFNFEGSYRYELIEEYHPEDFETLKNYIAAGNWNICGSTFENGDTNIPSPEALIRNVLYGNSYFYDKFKKKSNDIFLPDCFGFGRALPQVMTSCGLTGFSTQKLSWGCSIEPPFEIGKWKGLDDSFVYTSIKAGNYSNILKELRSEWINNKLDENIKTANIPMTMIYYGTGDRGGSPHPTAMETVEREYLLNDKSDSDVIYGSVVDFFNNLKEMDKEGTSLQTFDKEFLMSTHGCGSYTSRAASKRLNKKCENLLDVAEKANSLSSLLGYKNYPQTSFDFAWKKVLEHHFHDDITGTSFMDCYKKNWNDYFLALNSAKEEYLSAIKALESNFDTSKLAHPILVFNPNQDEATSTISIDMKLPFENVSVVDLKGNSYPAFYANSKLEFSARIKGNTLMLFDVIENSNNDLAEELSVSLGALENERYKVSLDNNFDICSIYDKKYEKELLASPIKYNLSRDVDSIQWPSWEIKYSDISRKPFAYFKKGEAKIIEDSPLKASVEINRVYNKSTLKEIISLEKASNRIEVYNEVNWHEDATNLKVSFPFTTESKNGTYDIGIAKYDRPNNTEKLYEVPCQKFAKIEQDGFGITVLTDSRQGFDKPTDNEIRLTAIHTPWSNYRYECSQHLLDFGKNIFSYAITSSDVLNDNSIAEAEKFTKPLNAFASEIHEGQIKDDLTLFSLSNNDARVMCFKKAINSNKYVLRVVDYYGKSLENVKVEFFKNIKSVSLAKGDEDEISETNFEGNSFSFDLGLHQIKTFMIEFEESTPKSEYEFATLPFDKIGITSNNNRASSALKNKVSIPQELIKPDMSYKGIKFNLKLDGKNALKFNNQEIKLNRKYKYVYLLLMNQGKDKEILINNKKVYLQNSFEYLGQWDLYGMKEYGYTKKLPQAFTFTHYHKGNIDQVFEDLYLYCVKVEIDSDTLVLNKNNNVALFASTYSNFDYDIECNSQLIDSLERRKFDYKLTKEEIKYTKMPIDEFFKGIFVNRRKTKYVNWWGGHCYQSPSDLYQIETEKKNFKRRETIKINDETGEIENE